MINNAKATADFCLEIQFEKNSENPSRIFRALSELIETMQYLDQILISSIDSKINPIVLLEDIQSGSVRTWLAEQINRIPDDALYHMDWKPFVGQYLVKGKQFIIKWCEGKTTITSTTQVSELRGQLVTLARETNIRMLPDYLGESKWECKFGKSPINVTIADKEWLRKFQDREILVQPQDSLRGRVQIEYIYDETNELIDTHYTMIKVIEVMPTQNGNQPKLGV